MLLSGCYNICLLDKYLFLSLVVNFSGFYMTNYFVLFFVICRCGVYLFSHTSIILKILQNFFKEVFFRDGLTYNLLCLKPPSTTTYCVILKYIYYTIQLIKMSHLLSHRCL